MPTVRPDLSIAVWRKSSHSLNKNDCIEITDHQFPGSVPIRDSKTPQGPAIAPTAPAWSTFVTAVAAANVDL
ncbi:DUF397 domain-containing protein [Streptomyces griseocarneus]|nr:DUF397 domain-containing protein [Streptomyces griseocarneus]